MIINTHGNIFNSDAEALVNPVNCIGVMGKGLALQFSKEFPSTSEKYKTAAKRYGIVLGSPFITEVNQKIDCKHPTTRFIIHFPTKNHWKDKSNILDIKYGLNSLLNLLVITKIKSIAIPPLGCGLGGLDWEEVKPLIEETFKDSDIKVYIYNP